MNLEATINNGFLAPHGVALGSGILAVVDTGHHELVLLNAANPTAPAIARLGGEGTDPAAEGLLFPTAVAFMAADRLVVADTHNWHLDFYRQLQGVWQYETTLADFGGIAPPVSYLVDVTVDAAGVILLLDGTNRRILSVDPATGAAAIHLQDPNWREPSALAQGGGYLWVADAMAHQVFRYDAAMNVIRIGSFGTLPGNLRRPTGVHFDAASGRLYVAEGDNGRISVFDANAAFIAAIPLPQAIAHFPQKLHMDGNARLFVADAAANRVYQFDTSQQGSASHLSRQRLDFGAVGIGYRLGLNVDLQNGSSTQPLQVQGITVVGQGFRMDPATSSPPFSIPASGSKRLTVAFNPLQTGLSAGQLRVETNDPNAGLMMTDLVGEGLAVAPMALAMVFDRSGSMSQSSGALSKIERLRAVGSMMVDLVSENQLDELTIVAFSSTASVGLPISALNPNAVNAAQGVIAGLTAAGATSIGAGLSQAIGQLGTSTLQRQNMIVLSDGKENTSPIIADISIPEQARVFTVGVGLAALLDVEKLESLAMENGGYFQVTDGNDEQLAKYFIQIASDVFGQQVAVDPVIKLRQGQSRDIAVHLCDADVSATVVVTWEDPNAQFDFELVSPSGALLGPSVLSWRQKAPRHLIGKVHLRGSRWQRSGTWKVRVTAAKTTRSIQAAIVSVCVASDLHLNWKVTGVSERRSKPRPPKLAGPDTGTNIFPAEPVLPIAPATLRQGDGLVIEVDMAGANRNHRLVSAKAVVNMPKVSLSELARHFAAIDLDKWSQRDLNHEHQQVIKKQLSAMDEKRGPTRRTYQAKPSKGKTAATFQLSLSGPDGIYSINLRVLGVTRSGEHFQRERLIQVHLRP